MLDIYCKTFINKKAAVSNLQWLNDWLKQREEKKLSYRWTPLLHIMMWQAPSLLQSSEDTESNPTPEALHAVYAQAAVRLDRIKDPISR